MDKHTKIILDRYSEDQSDGMPIYDKNYLTNRYLNNVINLNELSNKTLFEIGAGCSQYANIFLDTNLSKYYANDLIESRLELSRSTDERYYEIIGNFLNVEIDNKIDFVFASLTMMFVVPMFDDFIEKIDSILEKDGVFISFDPNYLCPLSFYRRFKDRKDNPARIFNPFSYSKLFIDKGYRLDKLIPFSGPYPTLGNSWITGTSFCMRVTKL